MQQVRQQVVQTYATPADILAHTASSVAELIGSSVVVQGGLRLLVQSADEFAELEVDPYALWLTFAEAQFAAAAAAGQLRSEVDVTDAAWLFVSAFMGSKEIVGAHHNWPELHGHIAANVALILKATLQGP